jgi:hypothetical protein
LLLLLLLLLLPTFTPSSFFLLLELPNLYLLLPLFFAPLLPPPPRRPPCAHRSPQAPRAFQLPAPTLAQPKAKALRRLMLNDEAIDERTSCAAGTGVLASRAHR